jgi:hypothetical protein
VTAAAAVALALLSLWSAARAAASPSWPLVKVRSEDVDVMAQLGEVLPQGGKVMVLSGEPWIRDPWSDWGPAFTGREFVLTVQGSEWLGPRAFGERRRRYREVQECVRREDVECIARWVGELRPQAMWVTRECRCPQVEEWLERTAAGRPGEGIYLLEGGGGELSTGHNLMVKRTGVGRMRHDGT